MASDIGKLDAEAILRVRDEAWPDAANADELHDAMLWLTFLTDAEVAHHPGWRELIAALTVQKRVTQVTRAPAAGVARGGPPGAGGGARARAAGGAAGAADRAAREGAAEGGRRTAGA